LRASGRRQQGRPGRGQRRPPCQPIVRAPAPRLLIRQCTPAVRSTAHHHQKSLSICMSSGCVLLGGHALHQPPTPLPRCGRSGHPDGGATQPQPAPGERAMKRRVPEGARAWRPRQSSPRSWAVCRIGLRNLGVGRFSLWRAFLRSRSRAGVRTIGSVHHGRGAAHEVSLCSTTE
jgi:hypothetical protein